MAGQAAGGSHHSSAAGGGVGGWQLQDVMAQRDAYKAMVVALQGEAAASVSQLAQAHAKVRVSMSICPICVLFSLQCHMTPNACSKLDRGVRINVPVHEHVLVLFGLRHRMTPTVPGS